MAAAALTSKAPRGRSVSRALTSVYLTIWAATLLIAAAVALLARRPAHELIGLSLRAQTNAPPHLAGVLALTAHNLPICGWPLLIGSLRLDAGSSWRRVLDVTVLACALANVLPVACALGGYGRALLPYVPQLPLEWAALAVGYGSWALERRRPLARSQRLGLLGVLTALLLAAGALETYAVPHRQGLQAPRTQITQINTRGATGRVCLGALVFQSKQSIFHNTIEVSRQAKGTPEPRPCHGRLGR
jgi:hypothetical protein